MQPDTLADVLLFHVMMSIETEDADRSRPEAWKSETKLEILAREIVQCDPALARHLVNDGMLKLAA
ncbi:MAG TPA: hypothetical protein DIT64_20855 [Verrucomicrobiales bacterium]|nr:hypothetical protein [Verrucomicrobiales bacterium]HCN77730.1 hypothetical protein [Verrucomicrobiales bacterium]